MHEIRQLLPLLLGILIIIFRKPIAISMAKSQFRIAKRKKNPPEILRKVEQLGYPIFEIATIAFGILCILWSLPDLLEILKTMF